MKIGLQTWGSDGDIRPFIALSGGLRKAGHEVTLCVASVDGKDYSALAAALDFRIIHFPLFADQDFLATAEKIKTTNDPFKQIQLLMDGFFLPFQDGMFAAAMEMAGECDLLIGHHIVGPLKAAADKCGRPYVSVFLCHSFIPSSHKAAHPFPNLGGVLNGILWRIGNALIHPIITRHFNRLRIKNGIAPLKDLFFTGWKSQKLNLIATSSYICNRQPDWDDTHQICGFFDVPLAAEEWTPSPALKDFLDAGEPPVYLTFGSMTQFKPDESTELMVQAATLSDKRAIIQSHWDSVKSAPENPDIFRIEKVPHHSIFPRCALVVHHGGAGTTHSATLCGAPSVVVAHAFDQEFWGSELKRMGIGGKVLNIRTVSPQSLAAEIRTMSGSKEAHEKAHRIGEGMRAENGVARAAELIGRAFARRA